MGEPAVLFDGVWKKFRQGERHDSLRDLVPSLFRRAFGRVSPAELREHEFWALKDVSFEVRPGEALGIVGPNGAGKSTTLKLLTRILRPTKGRCQLRGRVGALIEVAAGFHPDLTGRENIFLQAAIMGMSPAEAMRRLDDIIEFAGVRDFVDTPVKRYSSGMNARLGFAIASHLNPEVLIIDEVLSVGDMDFQIRCVARMAQFKREGAAIVFVSHNLQAVSELCERSLYLRNAAIALESTELTIARYVSDRAVRPQHGFSPVVIDGAILLGADGQTSVVPGQRLTLRVSYTARENLRDLTFGFLVHRSTDQLLVYDAPVPAGKLGLFEVQAGDRFELDFTFSAHLARGHYQIGCHVFHNPTHSFLARLESAVGISVHETVTHSGVASLDLRASVVHGGATTAGQQALTGTVGHRP